MRWPSWDQANPNSRFEPNEWSVLETPRTTSRAIRTACPLTLCRPGTDARRPPSRGAEGRARKCRTANRPASPRPAPETCNRADDPPLAGQVARRQTRLAVVLRFGLAQFREPEVEHSVG